jgi:hypothetical protein
MARVYTPSNHSQRLDGEKGINSFMKSFKQFLNEYKRPTVVATGGSSSESLLTNIDMNVEEEDQEFMEKKTKKTTDTTPKEIQNQSFQTPLSSKGGTVVATGGSSSES